MKVENAPLAFQPRPLAGVKGAEGEEDEDRRADDHPRPTSRGRSRPSCAPLSRWCFERTERSLASSGAIRDGFQRRSRAVDLGVQAIRRGVLAGWCYLPPIILVPMLAMPWALAPIASPLVIIP